MREMCEVEGRAGADRYFASIMMRLKCVNGEAPLVPRWSTISGSSPLWTEGPLSRSPCGELYTAPWRSNVLIDRVHDAGRLIQSQHEKILALKAANKELKASVNQELVAAAEQRVKELETKIKRMQAELESHRIQQRELKKEVGFLRSTELKVEGHKVVAAYKVTRGFESGLEKMGRVSYKFGYRVALEQLREKHSDIMIELDPFAECFEDANVEMDLDQPFYDDTPSEKQPTL
ncbi:hypothetical protein BHE74_00035025 [Ensete ventricosum]|nr:hypothetical protein BHE74_00035025 [Ensete ventricosum]